MSDMTPEERSDRFDFTWVRSQCDLCTRISAIPGPTPVCQAFPGAIPYEVLANRIDHRQPIDGDEGMGEPGTHFLFEPRADVPPAVLDRLYATLDKA